MVGQPSPDLPEAGSWGAIHTWPRCEKLVAEWLQARGVSCWLPLVPHHRSYGARRRVSLLPLFPGYLFYDAAAMERRQVFQSQRVTQVLLPDDADGLRADLHNLARALASAEAPRRREEWVPGTPVEVTEGPLQGTRGELVRAGGKSLLVIGVRFLGFAAELTIDAAQVRPLA